MRVERRLKNLGISPAQLADLPPVFADMTMVNRVVEPPPSEKKLYISSLFMAAAELNGMPAAFALLPQNKRTAYRAHLKQHCAEWWDVDALWAGWPNMLAQLKIADPKVWY